MKRFFKNNLFITAVVASLAFAACNENPAEPEPEPDPVAVSIDAPEQMYKDDLKPIAIKMSHPDGISGTVRYTIDGQDLFNKQLNAQRWDTTFTPTLPTESNDLDRDSWSRVVYDVESKSEIPSSAGAAVSIPLDASPWYDGELGLADVLNTRSVNGGSVTLQHDGTVLDIVDGAALIPRSKRVAKEDLEQGIEYLVQADGFVPLRNVARLNQGELEEAKLIPFQTENFDFETYRALILQDQKRPDENGVYQFTGNSIIWAYPKNKEIKLYIADRSVWEDRGSGVGRYDTDNSKLWPSTGYVEDVERIRDLTAPFLEEVAGISFVTYMQSQDDDQFVGVGIASGSLNVGSWNDGPYDISRGTSHDFGLIDWTSMLQKVTAENGPAFESLFQGTCFDFLQSLLGTPENPRYLCGDDGLTSSAKPVFRINYTFGADAGWYRDQKLIGSNAETVSDVWYVHNEP